jgi:signal transduction histidine kinase
MNLRVQVLVLMVVLVSLAVFAISGTLVARLRLDLDGEVDAWSQTMRENLVDRGKAITNNAALSAAEAIDAKDFLFLASLVKSTTAQDPEIRYGFLADKNGRVLVHSDPKKAGTMLKAEEYKTAEGITARDVTYDGKPAIEIVAPVTVANFPWGTLHFGMSLEGLEKSVGTARSSISERIKKGTTATAMAGGLLMLGAGLLGLLAAQRIISPLRSLAKDVEIIRGGNRDHLVRAQGCREFVLFGMGINELTDRTVKINADLEKGIETLKKSLEEAKRAAQGGDEFLASVSHELNTPLNAILSLPPTLLKDYKKMDVWHCASCGAIFEPEPGNTKTSMPCPDCNSPMKIDNRLVFAGDATEHLHFMERVSSATDHMRRIVQSFIDYSSLAGAQLEAKTEQVDVRQILDDVRNVVVPLANEKKITVGFPKIPNAVPIIVDRTMITQVLINLVTNSVKFTPAGGKVGLDIEAPKPGAGGWRFRVRDTGIGIAKDKLEEVFAAFYQVDGGHTRQYGGTGLGLSIARKLVELHNGRIWAESEGANKGSTFTFELPASGSARS